MCEITEFVTYNEGKLNIYKNTTLTKSIDLKDKSEYFNPEVISLFPLPNRKFILQYGIDKYDGLTNFVISDYDGNFSDTYDYGTIVNTPAVNNGVFIAEDNYIEIKDNTVNATEIDGEVLLSANLNKSNIEDSLVITDSGVRKYNSKEVVMVSTNSDEEPIVWFDDQYVIVCNYREGKLVLFDITRKYDAETDIAGIKDAIENSDEDPSIIEQFAYAVSVIDSDMDGHIIDSYVNTADDGSIDIFLSNNTKVNIVHITPNRDFELETFDLKLNNITGAEGDEYGFIVFAYDLDSDKAINYYIDRYNKNKIKLPDAEDIILSHDLCKQLKREKIKFLIKETNILLPVLHNVVAEYNI